MSPARFRRLILPAAVAGAALAAVSTASATAWLPMGAGLTGGPAPSVNAITSDAAGNVYAAGTFTQAGTIGATNVARWDGTQWHPMDTGLNGTVYALAVDSHGHLYAGGNFSASGARAIANLARWNGTEWEPVAGGGTNGPIFSLAADATGDIYAGGQFSTVGIVPAANIAKWNGVAWTPLGTGTNDQVSALAFDAAGNLYAGGQFNTVGGVSSNRAAVWNGTAWAALPGIAGTVSANVSQQSWVSALTRDTSGRINAAGNFSTTNLPNQQQSVAQWNGSRWIGLGSGVTGTVSAIAPQAAGGVMVGGSFSFISPAVALDVASWNGTTWSAIGGGINNPVYALANDAAGNTYAGGNFTVADGVATTGIAMKPVVPPATPPASAPCEATFYQQATRTWKNVTSPGGQPAVKVISRIRIFQDAPSWCQTDLTFILRSAQTKQRLQQLPGSTLGYRTLQGQNFNAPVISWPTNQEFRFTSGDPTGQNRVNARLVLVSYLARTAGMPTQPNVELVVVRQIPTNPAIAASAANPIYAQTNAMGTTVGWAQVN